MLRLAVLAAAAVFATIAFAGVGNSPTTANDCCCCKSCQCDPCNCCEA